MHHPMEVFRVSCQHPTDTLEWQGSEGAPGSPQPPSPRRSLNLRLGSSSSAWAPQALVGRDDVMAQVCGVCWRLVGRDGVMAQVWEMCRRVVGCDEFIAHLC